jgi:hypothetical protein
MDIGHVHWLSDHVFTVGVSARHEHVKPALVWVSTLLSKPRSENPNKLLTGQPAMYALYSYTEGWVIESQPVSSTAVASIYLTLVYFTNKSLGHASRTYFIQSFIHSFIPVFIHTSIVSLILSFTHSIIHPFIHS